MFNWIISTLLAQGASYDNMISKPIYFVSRTDLRMMHILILFSRVAILIHTEENFCYNSKILDGQSQMRVRHLEILQYKVIQVST